MQPKISVIIPAYNIEGYLGRTLDSVLAQTYKNLEILIINDGSTDNTAKVIEDYTEKDSRIRGINKENGGVTSARLRGIWEATGEWIGFVDGDDVLEPWMYEKLLSNAVQYHADISHCGYQMVLPSGKVRSYHDTKEIIVQDHQRGIVDLLTCQKVEPGIWNKLYRADLVKSVMASVGMSTEIKNTEDLLMNFYLFRASQCSVFEDVCPYHYIVRQGSAANSALNEHQLLDPLRVRKILFSETANDPEQHTIVANQLIRDLVTLASLDASNAADLIVPIRKKTRKQLQQLLPQVLREPKYTVKSKITALWVSVFPSTYRWAHKIYAKATGIDQIYEK